MIVQRIGALVARLLVPAEYREEFLGDLMEAFHANARALGSRAASRIYVADVIASVPVLGAHRLSLFLSSGVGLSVTWGLSGFAALELAHLIAANLVGCGYRLGICAALLAVLVPKRVQWGAGAAWLAAMLIVGVVETALTAPRSFLQTEFYALIGSIVAVGATCFAAATVLRRTAATLVS